MSETKRYEDHLNRKKLAGQVLDTLLQQEHVKVMSLNGGWGSGKTYFLDFMREYAESKGILFITHNVLENDYLDDPFLSIMAEIESQVTELLKPLTETSPVTLDNKSLALIKKSWRFVKKATNTLFQSSKLTIGLPKVASINLDTGALFKIKDYEKLKKAKKEFKQELGKIIESLPNKKLIIAIDEVDRTRPEYAIRTLEVIKHFFDIDGLKFILAVDKKQLQNTVKQMFGQDTETDCYLRKFVDLEWNLPAPSLEMFVKAQLETWDEVFARQKAYVTTLTNLEIDCYTSQQIKQYQEKTAATILHYLKDSTMTLRDIEKLFIHLKIILTNIGEEHLIELTLLLDLLYIYKHHVRLFLKMQQALKEGEDHFIDNSIRDYFSDVFQDPEYNQKFETSNSIIPMNSFFVPPEVLETKIPRKNFKQLKQNVLSIQNGLLLDGRIRIDNRDLKNGTDEFKQWYDDINKLREYTLLKYFNAIEFAGGFNSDD